MKRNRYVRLHRLEEATAKASSPLEHPWVPLLKYAGGGELRDLLLFSRKAEALGLTDEELRAQVQIFQTLKLRSQQATAASPAGTVLVTGESIGTTEQRNGKKR